MLEELLQQMSDTSGSATPNPSAWWLIHEYRYEVEYTDADGDTATGLMTKPNRKSIFGKDDLPIEHPAYKGFIRAKLLRARRTYAAVTPEDHLIIDTTGGALISRRGPDLYAVGYTTCIRHAFAWALYDTKVDDDSTIWFDPTKFVVPE